MDFVIIVYIAFCIVGFISAVIFLDSEESKCQTKQEVWELTFWIFMMIFAFPVLLAWVVCSCLYNKIKWYNSLPKR